MPYLTLFQNILSLFSRFEVLKVSKPTFWNKSAQAWIFLRKRINAHVCLLDIQGYQRPNYLIHMRAYVNTSQVFVYFHSIHCWLSDVWLQKLNLVIILLMYVFG